MSSTSRFLTTALVVPLTLAAAASVIVSVYCPMGGFFGNVATELIGIIITVVYVDRVVQKRAEERWRPVTSRMPRRLRDFADTSERSLQKALRITTLISHDDINGLDASGDLFERLAAGASRAVRDHVPTLPVEAWPEFVEAMNHIRNAAEILLASYQAHLTVEEVAALATIETHLSDSLVVCSESRDILSKRLEDLTPDERRTRDSRVWLVTHNLERAVLALGKVGRSRSAD